MATEVSYKIKRIQFFGREVPIFSQNANGPCPLLAIANILSLRNSMRLEGSVTSLSEKRLMSLVAECVLDVQEQTQQQARQVSPEYEANLQQNVQDCLEVLPKLTTGIDVNVRFNSINSFESTREITAFDLLGIPLLHGWLVDPTDTDTAAALGQKSYNELIEMLVSTMDADAVSRITSSRSSRHPSLCEPRGPHRASGADMRAAAVPSSDATGAECATEDSLIAAVAERLQLESDVVAGQQAEGRETCGDLIDLGDDAAPPTQHGLSNSQAPEALTPSGQSVSTAQHDMPVSCSDDTFVVSCDVPLADAAAHVGGEQHAVQSSCSMLPELAELDTGGAQEAAAVPLSRDCSPGPDSSSQQTAAFGRRLYECMLIKDFLEAHASQLTAHGLASLAAGVAEHTFATFFRNNHFNTLFVRGGKLFVLVTDQGYLSEPGVVWERLDDIHGNTQMCTHEFEPHVSRRATPVTPPMSSPVQSIEAAAEVSPEHLAGLDPDTARAVAEAAGVSQHYASSRPQDEWADRDLALALQYQEQEEFEARRDAEAQRKAAAASAGASLVAGRERVDGRQPGSRGHSAVGEDRAALSASGLPQRELDQQVAALRQYELQQQSRSGGGGPASSGGASVAPPGPLPASHQAQYGRQSGGATPAQRPAGGGGGGAVRRPGSTAAGSAPATSQRTIPQSTPPAGTTASKEESSCNVM